MLNFGAFFATDRRNCNFFNDQLTKFVFRRDKLATFLTQETDEICDAFLQTFVKFNDFFFTIYEIRVKIRDKLAKFTILFLRVIDEIYDLFDKRLTEVEIFPATYCRNSQLRYFLMLVSMVSEG